MEFFDVIYCFFILVNIVPIDDCDEKSIKVLRVIFKYIF